MDKRLKIAIIVIVIALLAYGIFYLTDYKHAQKQATDYLNGTDNVSVTKMSNGLFIDGYGNDSALIFYPGAKIEYVSYLPLCVDLASRGVDCYLIEMPFNLAFLGQNSADEIIDSGNYSHYFMSGHSLGGFSAISFVNQTNKSDGVILLAGYPNSKVDKPVLSIYGSQDKAFNLKTYNESKDLMDNLTEFVIDGGNHGQFAYYGLQEGDGVAKISTEKQLNETVEKILDFINSINNS